ncbi:hypothetical protein HRI_001451200 [Hibiscus trionum]|uniref:FAS1 domain-containing protein n=1 Tax=Hibiscus trionum TaxID=183268 RepID=A0A9W7HHX0_HIBTR|nr:hypothetical protein HRI_001451200 [Hibiscus trionum]
MSISPIISFFFSIFLALLFKTHAFNITQILRRYSQFDTYNENLSKTGVAGQINSQKSVTVLVVANDQLIAFHTMPEVSIRGILSFHVVHGYYDAARLKSLPSGTTLPTFYPGTTALTSNYEGNGVVTFRSAGENPGFKGVQLLGTIEDQPQIISILQVASIIPIGDPASPPSQQAPSASPKASPPRKMLAPAPAPPPSTQEKKSPSPSPSPAPAPSHSHNKTSKAPAPSPSTKTKPGKNAHAPSPSTKTKPSKSGGGASPSPSTKATPSHNNAPSPPPAARTHTTTPSHNAPSPSNTAKPSITAPSEAPTESNSTAPPPAESQAPGSSNDEAQTPVASPPKPSSSSTAAAAAPATTDVPAPAPEKASAAERMSSGNYLAIFAAARFLLSII